MKIFEVHICRTTVLLLTVTATDLLMALYNRITLNFLNYYYTIYKLCELLGERQFLPYFPMLKDREKMMEQDSIWKQICQELNWEFVSTI